MLTMLKQTLLTATSKALTSTAAKCMQPEYAIMPFCRLQWCMLH